MRTGSDGKWGLLFCTERYRGRAHSSERVTFEQRPAGREGISHGAIGERPHKAVTVPGMK